LWDLTPREIHACFVEHYRTVDENNMRTGSIIAAMYNVRRQKRNDRVFSWSDFFQPATSQRKKGRSLEDLRSIAKQTLADMKRGR
jgi:hypothetical protein